MKWFILAIKKYSDYTGRSSRREFWMFVLFYVLFAIIAGVLDKLLGFGTGRGLIATVYKFLLITPAWAVAVRRLRDIGKSGKWVPIFVLTNIAIGLAYVFLLFPGRPRGMAATVLFIHFLIAVAIIAIPMSRPGAPGYNEYGPNPNEPEPPFGEFSNSAS